ncbi:phage tail protein, partial [Bordetella avium]|uniref:phage tail protein n=1 Tax=Bordetella avium TaxID=521 RepID=UPI0039FB8B7B
MSTYFGILTKVGEAKEANAHVLGVPMRISEMAVGDGGGTVPIPDREQSTLIGQKRRALLNRLYEDPNNPNWIVAEQIIPEGEGGWWIRELGLFDQDGDLVAVANCPPTYKPQLAEGSGRTQIIRMVLLVTSVENIVLKIDPTVVLATREHVDLELAKKVDKSAVIDVPHGGTGRTSVAVGRYLRGNGALKLEEVTPAQVFQDLGINQAIVDAIAALGTLSRVYSITDLPITDVGPIIVREAGEVWNWVDTPFFQGYRSPLCGRPVDGHTVTPLASEVDAVGGIIPKASYARLWGYAQENGLVVSQATWAGNVGAHFFVDVDADTFRVPDLRNMFRRFTGTDA